MTNKNMTERDALAEVFPDATLQFCLFHVLRCFGRENMRIDSISIRSAERRLALDLLQKLAYSRTEEIYEITRKQFNDVGLVRITDHYESCWHPIRH